MKNFYYLKTCNTCQRIIKELNLGENVEIREIKSSPLSPSEIDQMAGKSGSYKSIFNTRARKLREKGLKASELTEKEIAAFLKEDYSFLKRPLLETENVIIAGNSASVVESMKKLSS